MKENISRKEFLKLGGVAIASTLASSCGINETEEKIKYLSSENIHGTEVYGLNEIIDEEYKIIRLYQHFDTKISKERGIKIYDKAEQRKELLDPNERYLEVVVRQSAYDSFNLRKNETNVDFVEWIQMETDAMNRCFDNAKPKADGKSILKRIIVISDNLTNNFWTMDNFKKGKNYSLDDEWRTRFIYQLPIDIDDSWAIANDYRINTNINSYQPYFWSFYNKNGKTIFGYPPGLGSDHYYEKYIFPNKNDSINDNNGVWLDFGLIHEWSHYLWNLPDEYIQDVHVKDQEYNTFLFHTGNFTEPSFSAYLSSIMKNNIDNRIRSPLSVITMNNKQNYPSETNITVSDNKSSVNKIEIRTVNLENVNDYYGSKYISDIPDQISENNQLNFDNNLYKNNASCWQFRCYLDNDTHRELYVPKAPFIMTKNKGRDHANYNINFYGYNRPNLNNQIVELVDNTRINSFIKEKEDIKDYPYASMKIDGTDTWLVWSLRLNMGLVSDSYFPRP